MESAQVKKINFLYKTKLIFIGELESGGVSFLLPTQSVGALQAGEKPWVGQCDDRGVLKERCF